MGYYTEEDGTGVHYTAIHRKVLIVYTSSQWDWKAYALPVPGENHDTEARMWRSEGTPLTESQAQAFWPSLTSKFRNKNLPWRW
jgi:hypothetical protein